MNTKTKLFFSIWILLTGLFCSLLVSAQQVSITDASIAEGTGGVPTELKFAITLSMPLAGVDVRVDYVTTDGTASSIDGSTNDYTATSGTVTIVAGDSSAMVTVLVNSDMVFEADETLSLTLSNPVNAVLNPSATTAIGTIINDEDVTLTMQMEKSGIDMRVASNTRVYACAVLVSTARDRDKVLLFEYQLPSGQLLRTVEVYSKTLSPSGDSQVWSCSVEPALDLGAIVVAYTVTQNLVRRAHVAVVNASTFVSTQTRANSFEGTSIGRRYISIRRVGDNFIMLLARSASDWDIQVTTYFGLPTPNDIANNSFGYRLGSWLKVGLINEVGDSGATDAFVDNSDPLNPRLVVSQMYHDPDPSLNDGGLISYLTTILDVNGNPPPDDEILYNTNVLAFHHGGGTNFVKPQRVFAPPYINLANNQISLLVVPGLLLTTELPLEQVDLWTTVDLTTKTSSRHNLTTGVNNDVSSNLETFPSAMDATLYKNSDWLVASRNATTSQLNLQRAAADYLVNGGNPKLSEPLVVNNAIYCGTPIRESVNFTEIQVMPSGMVAVALVSCTDPGLDQKIQIYVVDVENELDINTVFNNGFE